MQPPIEIASSEEAQFAGASVKSSTALTRRDIALLACRILSLWMFLQFVQAMMAPLENITRFTSYTTGSAGFTGSSGAATGMPVTITVGTLTLPPAATPWFFGLLLIPPAIYALVAIVLWTAAPTLARRIIPEFPGDLPLASGDVDWRSLVYSLFGLYLLSMDLPPLLWHLFGAFWEAVRWTSSAPVWAISGYFNWASILRLMLGLWLFLGAPRAVQIALALRRMTQIGHDKTPPAVL